ncbi:Mvp1p [Ascoidea rubescens DSM 1968]|uniref:Sorting nexin MVP1 n=1 Tax=Ascoidea rubescens DSM 1968 TaxID=1344418 RepID=A0A1D2VB14_9ASCO|nr:Phox-like protein [Ascoidea rubescens DSM 1968]ODV58653.1 Phox-like protein [Ascoidea rubescens DSM 1968]
MDKISTWNNQVRDSFNPNSADFIKVTEIPEKEGLLFKHINYLIVHNAPLADTDSNNGRKVIRRYSDFVWLLEILLKKYPFRLIPELPPKKFSGSSNDNLFLQRRRHGLQRFLNQLMKHPILSKESLVIMFLTVPTDLNSWRRQANVDTNEEFKGKRISKNFIKNWHPDNQKLWKQAEFSIKDMYENWFKICILIERIEKRKEQIAYDNLKFNSILNGFIDVSNKIYSVESSDISMINAGLQNVNLHISNSASLYKDESHNLDIGIMHEFKTFQDYINSLRGLFERLNRLGGNTIFQAKKRVEINTNRFNEIKTKPDVRGSEVDRLIQSINRDKQDIISQTNRDWLIKECVLHEFVMFQETQYKITKIFQEWGADRLKYGELQADNWNQMCNLLQQMPYNRQ